MCWRTRGEGGHSWTELLASNSLTTVCCVFHTAWSLWVSSHVCNRGKTQIVSLFLFLSTHSELGSSIGQALVKLSISFPSWSHIPFLPLTHTPAVSLSLPPPLFHSVIYSSLCPGKVLPHIAGRGLARGAQEENISTLRANLAEDNGRAL